jgi:hypothetical protein
MTSFRQLMPKFVSAPGSKPLSIVTTIGSYVFTLVVRVNEVEGNPVFWHIVSVVLRNIYFRKGVELFVKLEALVVGAEVLQLCSDPVIGWPDAPPCLCSLRFI